MGTGRPPRLEDDPGLADRICELIEQGNPVITACEAEGVERSMFYRWLRQGDDGVTEPYASFRHRVTRARALSRVDALHKAKQGDMPGLPNESAAHRWYLEKTDANFQPRVRVQVEQEMDTLLRTLEAVCSSFPGPVEGSVVFKAFLDALVAEDGDDSDPLTSQSLEH